MALFKKGLRFVEKEEKDIRVSVNIKSSILSIDKNLESFKQMMHSSDYSGKAVAEAELRKQFLELKLKVNKLLDNVKYIMLLETELQSLLVINDTRYLDDKFNMINFIESRISTVIGILEAQPSIRELKEHVLDELKKHLSMISEALVRIKTDDENLKRIYKNIETKILA